MRGIFLVDFLNDRTIFLFVVSIEGASRGVRVAGNGRRLRSGSQPDLGRLWVTVRGHYEPLPSMAGMENPGAQAETPAFENLGPERIEGTSKEVRRVSEARSWSLMGRTP
jgi:hypothetical protein